MTNDDVAGTEPVQLGGRAPSSLARGAAAELFVAARIALLGYQVYRPLADDRGVDLVVDVARGRHVMVQVKAIRVTSGYVFMRKATFPLESWVVLALVVFDTDDEPHLFLIPATEWSDPHPPLVSRDYVGLKSAPEYGVSVRKRWQQDLAAWTATPPHIEQVLENAHPDR
ncbi:hypothetical protein RR21198_5807 [Rhodococcus rhodochrous ATCC 21198]|uniref:DUF4365 domain-containing protein n=1 Tax=Rhodococcus aetherivorans TaxID=191292 RepID=UPI0003E2BB60|nr:DUF4365 domain-containing protein [Rhodococcus aetherivorans]ETT28832.1 hypothetical protein RR21198_5807 [Rhodococcus rhodochrous ATCC 21198]NGP25140.1 DUF4365 domain-containing protein [Rhodococcus aetherivorans]